MKSKEKRRKNSEVPMEKLHPGDILMVQEHERQRIARDLHDQIGQIAISLGAGFNLVERAIAEKRYEDALKVIGENKSMLKGATERMKTIAFDLRPLAIDIMGPVSAIREYFERQTKEHSLEIEFEENLEGVELNNDVAIVVYRVVQEAIANIVRHAQASVVRVNIRAEGNELSLSIKDDGKGFDVERVLKMRDEEKMGLIGIKERVDLVGGTLVIDSSIGKGTCLIVLLPLESKRKAG